jgi:hypothetical protein
MRSVYRNRSQGYFSAVRKRCLRDLRWRQLSARKRGGKLTFKALLKNAGPITFTRIKAPKTWSLYEPNQRRELAKFIKTYRATMLQGNGGAIVDFSLTETIYPSGGLLVHAELDRISRLVKDRRRMRCKPAQNSLADQVLKQVGMYKSLDHPYDNVPAIDQSVVHWRSATGLKAQGQEGWSVVENFEGELSNALKGSLFKGITEALTNAVHHAYQTNRKDGTNIQGEKRWWMFSQQRDGFLTIVFCDLGIGIPNSLPLKKDRNLNALLAKFKGDRSDVQSIRLATELGKTRTLEDNRGLGLSEILDAARNAEQGRCVIYSNRGQFGFSDDGRVIENQYYNSIYGTLIEWRVPLAEDMANDSQSNKRT